MKSYEYEKIIFSDPEKEKEWDELDPSIKKHIRNNLEDCVKQVSLQVSIDVLAHVLNSVILRIEKLENFSNKRKSAVK